MKQRHLQCRLTALFLAMICIFSLTLFGQSATTVSAASQTDLIKNGSVVYLKNLRSGKYLDVAGASAKNGANVQQYTFHGKKNQQWKLVSTGNDTYKIVSMLGSQNYVLDIAGGKTSNGANLLIWKNSGKDNQRFLLQSATSKSTKILTKKTSYQKGLAVQNGSKSNKANVIQWTYNAGGNDQWVLEVVRTAPPASSPAPKPPTSSAAPKPPASSAPTQPPTSSEPTNPPLSNGAMSDTEKEVVRLVNVERAKEGLAPLQGWDELSALARLKSQDMTKNNYFDHHSPTYGSPFDMMHDYGFTFRYAGENIAQGHRSPEEVVQAWMDSPGHRANIMHANYTKLGVGYDPASRTWTQMFIG